MRNAAILSGLGLFLSAGTSVVAQCVPGWTAEPIVGLDNRVRAQVVWDPDGAGPLQPVLVVAGEFVFAGAQSAQRIATWDGQHWAALQGGGLNGTVRALAVYNGSLVASGDFTLAGGVPAAGIASYDGTAWHALGVGLDAPGYALLADGSNLYAGGVFVNAGGQSAVAIARWDGATWHSVGGGMDGPVYALGSLNGDIYAGGSFATAGGTPAASVARWDGSAWSALGAGVALAGGGATVLAMTNSGGSLVVGGHFDHAGVVATASAAAWNGSDWSGFGGGVTTKSCQQCTEIPAVVRAVAEFGGQVHATGESAFGPPMVLTRWDGVSWNRVPNLPPVDHSTTELSNSLAVYDGGIFIGGYYDAIGSGGFAYNDARWDGAAWSKLGGIDLVAHAVTPYSGGLIAAGEFTEIEGVPARVAFFDGSHWQAIGNLNAGTVYSTATDGTHVFAGASGGEYEWDGTSWTRLGTLPSTPKLYVFDGALYALAAGDLTYPSGVMKWNGSAWVAVGTTSNANSLVSYNQSLVGAVTAAGINGVPGKWNGIAWVPATTAFVGTPSLLAVMGNVLVASWIDGTITHIASWDGSSWTQLGANFNSNVLCLGVVGGKLYAIGGFTMIGSMPAAHAAVWDGSAWTALGSGFSPYAFAYGMADFNGSLVVAGSFQLIGQRAGDLAFWSCAAASCYANCDASTASPVLNVADFTCFLQRYAAGDSYANCDASTASPVLNVADFTCFLQKYAAGCP